VGEGIIKARGRGDRGRKPRVSDSEGTGKGEEGGEGGWRREMYMDKKKQMLRGEEVGVKSHGGCLTGWARSS